MASSSLYEDEILDMLSTDSPLLTPPPATPAPSSNGTNTTLVTTTERQVTTRVFARGPAQNAYVTVPESSPLLRRDDDKLPALMANDQQPVTDPRPFYASPYEKLPKSLEYTDFRSAFYPDIQRPDYNTTLQQNNGLIFFHI